VCFAQPVRVSVNIDGFTYLCGTGNSEGADPQCTKELSDFCSRFTNYTSGDCFEKARKACAGAVKTYSGCVQETSEYCYKKTNLTAGECFEKSLVSCRGNFGAIKQMMDFAAEKAQSEEKGPK